MKKNNARKHRKIFILIIVIMITAITLAVETYAWFVGLSTASTGDITIAISSADGLDLSLNGQYWTNGGTELKIKDTDHTYITETGCTNANCAYSGHKNVWPTDLTPVSTIGEIDTTSSRLKLFQKNSLTANPGGYYITSSQVPNSTNEGSGYVAFDLFIRNGKGTSYNGTYNMASEEDIYLSADSLATTVVSGSQPDYGAANSVRVGFFELGRVAADGYTPSTITEASCMLTSSGRTPLCTSSTGMTNPNTSTAYTMSELQGNTWNIWEPNHASHTTNLVSYFNTACKKRNGNNYTSACQPIETGSSKKTYGMKETISTNNYNIYDGMDLNEYKVSPSSLQEVKTYKTSDATLSGNEKTPLIKVAGNSITKVRVYIWLEGQDIDNYDIISQNPSVRVKFGFTKDRNGLDSTNNTALNNRISSFQDDSWKKIKYNVQHGITSQYNVGDMRTVRINGNEYRLRLANKSSPSTPCNDSSGSQTACGFVVEFVDAVSTMTMRSTETNSGGYPATNAYTYLNGELLNSLPEELKAVIAGTRVVSGPGIMESSNYISNNQKLYLLSLMEIYGSDLGDTSQSATRQLDYYNNHNVTSEINHLYARKQLYGHYNDWWSRSIVFSTSAGFGYTSSGGWFSGSESYNVKGIAPAFRIG